MAHEKCAVLGPYKHFSWHFYELGIHWLVMHNQYMCSGQLGDLAVASMQQDTHHTLAIQDMEEETELASSDRVIEETLAWG